MPPELDFALIDDVFPLAADSPASAEVVAAPPRQIGPLVEYAFAAVRNAGTMPSVADLVATAPARELRRVLAGGGFDASGFDASHDARAVEFHWVPATPEAADSPKWITFLRRVESAAALSGFPGLLAKGLAAAFGEMADNAMAHSLRPASALAGYQRSAGLFEFVVADAGQGVLAGLRANAEFAHVADHGEAIQAALADGVSRFGRGVGRGLGFRRLFVSLVDLAGRLRFRSGDHALVMDGTSPNLPSSQLVQLAADHAGFLVSVACRPAK